ncbi:MAG TPA: type II secretion system minor pseudopilin GspK [Steroidobacteraceae bacterium]|nr:type II secretion system minor pseudopilin GspK [Steroidobacteraceae bacterium]
MRPVRSPGTQRGVALITAVLMVALATILAVEIGFAGYLDQRRSATLFALDQSYMVALGAEAWAADVLREDLEQTKTDHAAERWATPIPPLPIDGGEVEGFVEDLSGRFNLNSLVRSDGTIDEESVLRFARILEAVGLEPRWASMFADWLDVDSVPAFPDGAEDGVYNARTPPYRTPNMPITRTSELLALPEFGLERYQLIEPFVTALPIGTKLNVCTAPGVVLDALTEGTREFGIDPEGLANNRTETCFPSLAELRGAFGEAEFRKLENQLSETSQYFRATIWVSIGTTRFTLYSLLNRNQTGLVRPMLRSFGTS